MGKAPYMWTDLHWTHSRLPWTSLPLRPCYTAWSKIPEWGIKIHTYDLCWKESGEALPVPSPKVPGFLTPFFLAGLLWLLFSYVELYIFSAPAEGILVMLSVAEGMLVKLLTKCFCFITFEASLFLMLHHYFFFHLGLLLCACASENC